MRPGLIAAFFLFLAAAAPAQQQEGTPPVRSAPGDPPGKVDWVRDLEFGLFKAKIEGKAAALLHYYGANYTDRFFKGPLSNPKFVMASQRVIPILVDSTEPDKELVEKYTSRFSYYFLYVDPSGVRIKESEDYETGVITSEFEGLARKYAGRPSMWQNSVKGALANGKIVKKPVAIYFADPKASLDEIHAQLMKDLGDRKIKFLWAFLRGRADHLSTYGAGPAPSIVVLDPKLEDPVKAPVAKIEIKESDDKESINKALDEALKKK